MFNYNSEYHFKRTEYHYSSFWGFNKIMQSHRIRFSDLNSMNDPNEVNYLWNGYIKHFQNNYDYNNKTIYAGFLNYSYKRLMEEVVYFSLSLTDDGNSAPMWRLYADGGKGVVIGFDFVKLFNWKNRIYAPDTECVKLERANNVNIIGNGINIADFRRIIYFNQQDMDNHIDGVLEKHRNDDPSTRDSAAYSEIEASAPFKKKKAYEFEKEQRILITLRHPDNESKKVFPCGCIYGTGSRQREIAVKWDGEDGSRYYPRLYIPFGTDMIDTIRIGPYCEYDEKYVENLLRFYGYPVGRIKIERATE